MPIVEAMQDTEIDISKAGRLACESCGQEFTCNAGQDSCWCFDVPVSTENLTEIKEKFDNCLCRKCLEKQENLQG